MNSNASNDSAAASPGHGRDLSGIGVLVLAAGASRRLGVPKQTLRYGDRSLLRLAVESAVGSACGPAVVTLGANAELCRREINDLPVRVIENIHWKKGMSSSIKTGLLALQAEVRAMIIMTVDQPHVTARVIDQIANAYITGSSTIVASAYAGTLGVPALFDRTHFPDIMSLEGDSGAKSVIARNSGRVNVIPFELGAIDIDTLDDCGKVLTPVDAGAQR